jgi:hypothetical protein
VGVRNGVRSVHLRHNAVAQGAGAQAE